MPNVLSLGAKITNNSEITNYFANFLEVSEIPLIFVPRILYNFIFKIMNNIESTKGEIVMYQPDETIRLEVRVEDETRRGC